MVLLAKARYINALASPTSSLITGAWLAGICLGTVRMGLHHKLCHLLGGSYGLPHAPTHTVMLPQVMAHQAAAAPEAMRSRMRVTHAMLLNVINQARDPAVAIDADDVHLFTHVRLTGTTQFAHPAGDVTLAADALTDLDPRDGVARAVPIMSSRIRSAYGRSASIRASALRSFAAATSSIAFVILLVFLTELTRRLMSWTVAIYVPGTALSSRTAKFPLNLSISALSRSASSSGSSLPSRMSL